MANLANTMEANAVATLQAVQRLGQQAGNGNGDGNGTIMWKEMVHPPSFRGSINPTEADNWFQAMEHALQAQHVSNNQYVEFTAYQLLGEAQHWWQGECQLLRLPNVEIPWDVSQTAFYKKYFLESAREAKEMELMQLKQGSLSVVDYTSQFEELCRFSRACQVPQRSMKVGSALSIKGA
ncbi:uncharacterized protein LOC107640407 [Arachis ipaensis]|uniref:uncharacterized protein LOC107640407 n=1 Tax=Arachis ipaensis TaxID=130454 RepID=UPI0007AF3B7B|nr:uncharacterized protein LOC107640407 [Arachis ipaensis]